METLVAEFDLVPAAGPPSPGQAKPEHKPEPAPVPIDCEERSSQESTSQINTPVELQDVFDPRFFGQNFLDKSPFLAAVNEALLPSVSLPGQNIQPVDASDPARDLPSGSLTGFLRLEDGSGCLSDTIYALTSRHVAVQDLYDHHADFHRTSGSSQQHQGNVPDIKMHTGAAAAIDRQRVRLRDAKGYLADGIHRVKNVYLKNVSQDSENDRLIAFLELMEECHGHYIDEALEGMTTLSLRDESSMRTGQVGHVAFAAGHGIDTEGFWRDWALIALPPATHRAQPGLLFTNKVYIGHWLERVKTKVRQTQFAGRLPDGYTIDVPDAMDDVDFMNVQAPHPPMLMRRSTRVRPVVKRGSVTGLTVGLLSPIEAVVRRPLPGVDVVTWAWPVLSFVENPEYALQSNVFSSSGDSGSLVFDTDGVAVGMVDAGLGVNEKRRRTFQHHQAAQADSATAAPTTYPTVSPFPGDGLYLPDQSAVLDDFMRWDVVSLEGGPKNVTDITLITPIDVVFASIEKVTGQTPRMV
ncbi:hypothetical protein F503_01446 [Ophiostoma piceae UAMH 11346]|uniref:Uncharacterized protein n=1 Tax=Ophiostoma piceae (strain UAMH 11346) TaxID=1262450 RepID=S3BV79_OPHP1|nr:hypothetical protein F503_01446 [Ophiostoma piceae UAMH 11346]